MSHGIAQTRRGAIPRRGAHLASGPTLAWASSNTTSSWRRRAGAMGGGTEPLTLWRGWGVAPSGAGEKCV